MIKLRDIKEWGVGPGNWLTCYVRGTMLVVSATETYTQEAWERAARLDTVYFHEGSKVCIKEFLVLEGEELCLLSSGAVIPETLLTLCDNDYDVCLGTKVVTPRGLGEVVDVSRTIIAYTDYDLNGDTAVYYHQELPVDVVSVTELRRQVDQLACNFGIQMDVVRMGGLQLSRVKKNLAALTKEGL